MRVLPAGVGLGLIVLVTLGAACGTISEPSASEKAVTDTTRELSWSPEALPSVSLACGAQITSDVRLDNDLSCVGNAIVVSGDDITIDLNGHTLAGAGSGNGITVTASHAVTIFGGSVTGFLSGIFVSNSTGLVIRDNDFLANREAVLLQATTGSVIKHNVVTKHLMRAFMIRPNLIGGLSTDNLIVGNIVSETPTGIFLIRQPGNTVQNNTIVGSGVAAIDLGEGAGTVSDNIVRANYLVGGSVGIRFGAGWTSNTIVGNRIEANDCGMKGSTAGNTLNGNVFSANSIDACP
jgi:parallel beta-helix repeat protein